MHPNRELEPGEILVGIRSIAFGGDGVGEVIKGPQEMLGISAFIPYTAVGEKVVAKVVEHKQRYLKATLVEILQTSPERVEPKCKYFGTCGGCELQHLSYKEQLDQKHAMLCGAMKAGRISINAIEKVAPIVESKPFKYRRRISLHLNAEGRIGFYRPNSRSLIQIDSCVVATEEINEIIQSLKNFAPKVAGKISSVLLEQDPNGVIVVLKSPYDLSKIEIESILGEAKKYFNECLLLVSEKEVGGYGRKILELPINAQLNLTLPAGSFSQVNWEVNQGLISYACSKVKHTDRVCDLYSGAGNFAIPIARNGAEVVAVECEKRLVQLGKTCAKQLQLEKKLHFLEQSVESYLKSKPSKFDFIIADPPRNGLGALCSELSFSNKMLLISCSLSSFVRDLRALIENGWNVEEIIPHDMFAQTSYLEIAAYLTK